jgi:hypothetical protein
MRRGGTMVTTQSVQIGGRPPPKRPVYRSEFVIRLQTMRENRGKRGKNFDFELLDEPIDWRPSSLLATPSIPIRTTFGSVRTSSIPKFPSKTPRTASKVVFPLVEFPLTSGSSSPPAKRPAVIFNDLVDIYEVDDYDRKVDKKWTRLTQIEKLKIRCELNDFKTSEMIIHRDSRQHTRLHRI